MKKLLSWSILIVGLAGCDRMPGAEAAQTPEAAPIPSLAGVPLDTALAMLGKELDLAIEHKLDDAGYVAFQRAESITDRLLETRYPFQWLASESYSVQSRLRQIQSLADRVTAQVRSGMPPDSAVPDVRLVRQDVTRLREALKKGGGPAPPPLEKILAGQDTSAAAAPPGATTEPDQGH